MSDIALKFLKLEDKEIPKIRQYWTLPNPSDFAKLYIENKKKNSASKMVTISV